MVVVFNHCTLIRTRERSIILYCIGSSLEDRISSPSWVRERLGLGASKDFRPILIFKVCHLLLLYCIKLVMAICAWTHHCHSQVTRVIDGLFPLVLISLDITDLCLITICLFFGLVLASHPCTARTLSLLDSAQQLQLLSCQWHCGIGSIF